MSFSRQVHLGRIPGMGKDIRVADLADNPR